MLDVFTYWEHPPRGHRWHYIQFCLDTIRYHSLSGCRFHHITSANLHQYVPDGLFHDSWKEIRELGVKSDVVRAAVLHQHGGLYVDADTVMLRSPSVCDSGHQFGGMCWTRSPRRIIAGYCYCCPGSDVAARWVDNINAMLKEGRAGWTDLGEKCLTPAVDGADKADVFEWPIETFLPIEIDREVLRFFGKETPGIFDRRKTVAVGLNHSLMTRKFPKEMMNLWKMLTLKNIKPFSLIARLFKEESETIQPIRIGVCVPTFRRPELLGHLIHCFETQTYENRRLIAYCDHGELEERTGDKWQIISRNEPHASLGAKRNAIVRMMPDCDAYVMWDDDEIVLPHALEAIAHGLSRADWARASQVLTFDGRSMQRRKTYWNPDKSDKAYQCAWGFTKSAFDYVGGYPELSLGEDMEFARKLVNSGVSEADPVEMGWNPWLVASPYKNEHFSWECKDFQKWKEQHPQSAGSVEVRPHGIALGAMSSRVYERPWSGDWYKEEVR